MTASTVEIWLYISSTWSLLIWLLVQVGTAACDHRMAPVWSDKLHHVTVTVSDKKGNTDTCIARGRPLLGVLRDYTKDGKIHTAKNGPWPDSDSYDGDDGWLLITVRWWRRRKRRKRRAMLLASWCRWDLTSALYMLQNCCYWVYIFCLFTPLGNSVRIRSFSVVFVI